MTAPSLKKQSRSLKPTSLLSEMAISKQFTAVFFPIVFLIVQFWTDFAR